MAYGSADPYAISFIIYGQAVLKDLTSHSCGLSSKQQRHTEVSLQ
jgi:hypothetical protein